MENKPSFLATLSSIWPIAVGIVSAVLYLQSSILSLKSDISSLSTKIENGKTVQALVDQHQSAEISSLRHDIADLKLLMQQAQTKGKP